MKCLYHCDLPVGGAESFYFILMAKLGQTGKKGACALHRLSSTCHSQSRKPTKMLYLSGVLGDFLFYLPVLAIDLSFRIFIWLSHLSSSFKLKLWQNLSALLYRSVSHHVLFSAADLFLTFPSAECFSCPTASWLVTCLIPQLMNQQIYLRHVWFIVLA